VYKVVSLLSSRRAIGEGVLASINTDQPPDRTVGIVAASSGLRADLFTAPVRSRIHRR
jgi:hypothetical protein